MHDLSPRGICLPRKENISLFHFGHNAGVSLDFPMMNAPAVDHFAHLDEMGRRAFEADDRIPWRRVWLKLFQFESTLHSRLKTTRWTIWMPAWLRSFQGCVPTRSDAAGPSLD